MPRSIVNFLKRPLAALLLLFFVTTGYAEEYWVYTTKPGDNLWKLSKNHLVSLKHWKDLQKLNGIEDPLHIPVGTTVRFPVAWLKSGSSVGQVVALNGSVHVTDGGGTRKPAYQGMILWENYSIDTGEESSAVLQFSDGSKLQLLSDSDLALGKMTTYGATGMAKTKIQLKKGRTKSNVTPTSGPVSRFEISTPSAIAAVRGTEYRITAEENGESKAEVLRGEVGVESAEVHHVLPKGFGTVAYTDKKPLTPVPLLAAPDLSKVPKKIDRLPAVLETKPLESASAYRLQIAKEQDFTVILHDKTSTTNAIPCPDLPDDDYFLRIRGIDENGLEGLDSVVTFTMQAHPLPPMQIAPAANGSFSDEPVTFQWTEPQDASAYQFLLAGDKEMSQVIIKKEDIKKTSLQLELDLRPGLYYWGIATTDTSGKTGPFSDPQPLRRAPLAPAPPEMAVTDSGITIRWHEGEEKERYRCQVASDPEFTRIVTDEIVEQAQYQFAASSYGSYYIRLATIDSEGNQGSFSPYQKVEIPAPSYLGWIVPAAILLVILL